MELISRLWVCLFKMHTHQAKAKMLRPSFIEICRISISGQYCNAFLATYISLVSNCKITIFFQYGKIFFSTPLLAHYYGLLFAQTFNGICSDAARHVSTSLQNKIPVSVETMCTSSLHTTKYFFPPYTLFTLLLRYYIFKFRICEK